MKVCILKKIINLWFSRRNFINVEIINKIHKIIIQDVQFNLDDYSLSYNIQCDDDICNIMMNLIKNANSKQHFDFFTWGNSTYGNLDEFVTFCPFSRERYIQILNSQNVNSLDTIHAIAILLNYEIARTKKQELDNFDKFKTNLNSFLKSEV